MKNGWMDVFNSACTLDKVQVQVIHLRLATLGGCYFFNNRVCAFLYLHPYI